MVDKRDIIIKQIEYIDNAIKIAPIEGVGNLFKSFKIFLLIDLIEETDLKVDNYITDHLEFLNFLAFVGNPDKKQIIKDFLFEHKRFLFHEYLDGLDPWEIKMIFSLNRTLERLIEHLELKELKDKALLGDIDAQLKLGSHFYERARYSDAKYWFEISANSGNIDAQHNLGVYYHTIRVDKDKAFYWHKKAADQGDPESQTIVAEYYYYGEGTKVDYKMAFHWYQKGALSGNSLSQFRLGSCYLHGEGVEQDYVSAIFWFKRAAAQGDMDANMAWKQTYLKLPLFLKIKVLPFNEFVDNSSSSIE